MLGLCDSGDQTQGFRHAGQSHYKLAVLPVQHVYFQTKASLLNKCHIRRTLKAFNNFLIPKPSPYPSFLTPRQCVAKANTLLCPFYLPYSISVLPDTSFRLPMPSGLVSLFSLGALAGSSMPAEGHVKVRPSST